VSEQPNAQIKSTRHGKVIFRFPVTIKASGHLFMA